MKTYKLKDLEIYTVAFDLTDAKFAFLFNKIGVTENDIEEANIEPNRDAIGKLFRSLNELNNYEIQY